MTKLTLYDISETILALSELLDEGGTFDEEHIKRELDRFVGELLPEKVSGYAAVMRELELTVASHKAEEKRIAANRKRLDHMRDQMKGRLAEAMRSMDIKRVHAGTFTVTRCKAAPAVIIFNEDIIPAEFMRTKVEVDKTKIREALKEDGASVPGAALTDGTDFIKVK